MNSSYEGKQAADKFLEHHGILGMKWGVRRSRSQLGNTPKIKNTTKLVDSKEAVKSSSRALKDSKPDNAPKPLSRKEVKQQIKSKEKEWDARTEKIVDAAYQNTKKAVEKETQRAIDSLNIPEGKSPTKAQLAMVRSYAGKVQAKLMTEEMHRSGDGVSPGQKRIMNFGVTPNGEIFMVKEKIRKRDFAHDVMTDDFEDELWHYGILGMKWGVRRDRKGGGVFPNSPRGKRRIAKPGRDVLTQVKNRPKTPKAKTMSDKELRERLNRLNMEKQYSDLTSPAKQVGKSFVGKVVKGGATTVATAYVVKYITKGGEKVIEKIAK